MTSPVISIHNLSIRFGRKTVVNDFSLDIAEGERLAIVGESGSGKTLTGLSLIGLLPEAAEVSGSIGMVSQGDRLDLLQLSAAELRAIRGRDVAMIFQEPMTALNPLYTIGNQIVEAVICHEPQLSAPQSKARAIELLNKTGIPSPEERFSYYPHQLSGGQRQRLSIARALLRRPHLLVFDEATSSLDSLTEEEIGETIREVGDSQDVMTILIAHRLSTVMHADRIYVLERGSVVESGTHADLLAQKGLYYAMWRQQIGEKRAVPAQRAVPALA